MLSNSFPNPLIIRALPKWELVLRGTTVQLYEVREPFVFISTTYGAIITPPGFVTDFGSVPRLAKPIVDDDDPDLLYASIPHDLLYQHNGHYGDKCITRYESDLVLREAMVACGARATKAAMVFAGVRTGGGRHWGLEIKCCKS